MSGLRQLLEFGLFHGDPHPGNIFALRDGRIAYVDFGNVAQLSNQNKQVRGARRPGQSRAGRGGAGRAAGCGWRVDVSAGGTRRRSPSTLPAPQNP